LPYGATKFISESAAKPERKHFTSGNMYFKLFHYRSSKPGFKLPSASAYPLFLWVTLWITMFTSKKIRTRIGFADSALELITRFPGRPERKF
jgi:hypothetical protein